MLALRARSPGRALDVALLGLDHPLVRASDLLRNVIRQWSWSPRFSSWRSSRMLRARQLTLDALPARSRALLSHRSRHPPCR